MLLCRIVGLRPFVLSNVQSVDDTQNKNYQGTQLWTIDQNSLNGSSGSLRPLYVLHPHSTSTSVRLHQLIPPPGTSNTLAHASTGSISGGSSGSSGSPTPPPLPQRGRSSSPPVRLEQLRGGGRPRGQSSSPPEFSRGKENSGRGNHDIRNSTPRNNWRREFQSAIPVPVSSDSGRARFRHRIKDPENERTASAAHNQPMIALPPRHYNLNKGITSAPIEKQYHQNYQHQQGGYTNGRTKSPSPTRFTSEKFSSNNLQESSINQHTSSSGSESSDYFTPPAEPYLPLQPSEQQSTNHDANFDQSDHFDTPSGPPRERFIKLDSVSTSDFEEQDEKKDESNDETDFVRTQVYHKLQEEMNNIREEPFREKVSDKRLSKSHADLSEVKRLARRTPSSAPLVKHLRGLNNNDITFDEVSRSSLNSSVTELKSLNQSQAPSQLDLQSLNQSQGDLRSQGSSSNLAMKSQTDLRSLNQSQIDLHRNMQSQSDLQSVNDSQISLQDEKVVKYPEIVRKKSLPKKSDLKRRASVVQNKIPTVFPDTLRNFPKPREGLSEMVSLLESPEWEQNMRGLQNLVRLCRHHPETIEAQLHTVCVLLGRHIKNLRSQVARAACLAASEMFDIHKKTLETELEELAVPLLHRTADTNKFLRSDANAALDTMSTSVSTSKVVGLLCTRGALHQNATVRCATARLLTDLVHRITCSRVFQMHRETRDRILYTGANMLMEGSLETRKHAKNMFLELCSYPYFQRAMSEAVPATTMRHISKILNSLK